MGAEGLEWREYVWVGMCESRWVMSGSRFICESELLEGCEKQLVEVCC